MGLNMPARTVVFTSVRKFDGKDFRWVSAHAWTIYQMSDSFFFLYLEKNFSASW